MGGVTGSPSVYSWSTSFAQRFGNICFIFKETRLNYGVESRLRSSKNNEIPESKEISFLWGRGGLPVSEHHAGLHGSSLEKDASVEKFEQRWPGARLGLGCRLTLGLSLGLH